MRKKNVVILVGLPGSGKTEYAKRNYTSYKIIDCDSYLHKGVLLDDFINIVTTMNVDENIVLDGLFLTEEIQNKLYNKFCRAHFVYFEPNIEHCLYNDSLRDREQNSRLTIKNAKIHKPTRNCSTVKTLKYDYIQYLIANNGFHQTYQSKRISRGGTVGTCWDEDGPTEIEPDDEELEISKFKEFSEILTKLNAQEFYDDLTYLVNSDADDDNDYYGGCETFVYLEFDTRQLITKILELKYSMTCFDTKDVMQKYPELFV